MIHRVGRIAPGENIVLVLTASPHRQAAFEAAEFLMDYLKANAPFWKREESAAGHELGRRARPRRRRRRALDQILMAKRAKPAAKRGRAASKFPKVGAGELLTLLDFVRYAVSRFIEAELVFAHGTTDPVAEAAFLVCETLHLHPDQFETFATARVTAREAKTILDLIARRVTTRKPAAYLVNKIYMRGLPFYVDERTIVPRSFIGELLDQHFGGDGRRRRRLADRRSGVGGKRARPLHRLGLSCDPGEPEFSAMPRSTRWIFRRTRSRSPRAMSPITGWTTA